ncbi:unnamed protein product, partial [Rotaria sordida]
MENSTVNNRVILVENSIHAQNSHVNNQQVENSINNQYNQEDIVSINNQTTKMYVTTTTVCKFIVFAIIIMIAGILIVCFTSPKHTIKKCELNFVLITPNPIEYNYGPRSVAVGHFNNDTWLDIVVANHVVGTIVVFFGYDNGTFEMQTPYSTGDDSSPTMVAVDDFNKDNRLDVAVANFGTNSIGIFLGYEDGLFENQILISISSSRPLWIHIADFNNDTLPDIVSANYGIN